MSSSASHPPSDTAAEVPTRPWDGVSVTPEDSPGLVSTEEELNFVRLSKLLVRRVPEALRTLLKENWEEFQSRRKEPIDPALIAVTTYSRRHNRDRGANVYCRQMRGFQIQHEGQRKRVEKWEVDDFDVSLLCMFLSLEWEEEDGTVDRVLDDEAKRKAVRQIRSMRNEYFGHFSSNEISNSDFEDIWKSLFDSLDVALSDHPDLLEEMRSIKHERSSDREARDIVSNWQTEAEKIFQVYESRIASWRKIAEVLLEEASCKKDPNAPEYIPRAVVEYGASTLTDLVTELAPLNQEQRQDVLREMVMPFVAEVCRGDEEVVQSICNLMVQQDIVKLLSMLHAPQALKEEAERVYHEAMTDSNFFDVGLMVESDAMKSILVDSEDLTAEEIKCRRETFGESMRCVVNQTSWNEEVLGLGLHVKERTQREIDRRLLPDISITLDYISISAYNSGVTKALFQQKLVGEKSCRHVILPSQRSMGVNAAFPLYINRFHWEKCRPSISSAFSIIDVGNNDSKQPGLFSSVCSQVMFSCVIQFTLQYLHLSDRAIQQYALVHRTFLELASEDPRMTDNAREMLLNFMKDKKYRSRASIPNLGIFIQLLSIVPDVTWDQLKDSFVRQQIFRQSRRSDPVCDSCSVPGA